MEAALPRKLLTLLILHCTALLAVAYISYDVKLPSEMEVALQRKLLTTRCKINLTFQSQKPPNFKVVLE